MFLFKRKGYYHLEYFDEVENRPKRIPFISSIDKSGYIFEKTAGVIYRSDTVSKCFKKAVREAKLDEKIHIHTL